MVNCLFLRFATHLSWAEIFCELPEFPMMLERQKESPWSWDVDDVRL